MTCEYKLRCGNFEHEDFVCCFMPPLCSTYRQIKRYERCEHRVEKIKHIFEDLREVENEQRREN